MIKNLFLEVINMSITASVVILAVIVLRWLFRKLPKIYSYLLWSMVLFRLLCPYSFSLDTSAFNLLPAKQTEKGRIEYTVPEAIVENIMPLQETDFLPEVVISPQISTNEDVYVPQAEEQSQNIIVMAPRQKIDYVNIFALLWLAGVLYMIADNLISLYEIKLMLANSQKLYGNVYKSDVITTAFIIGVISPKIYLPKNLGEEQQRYIIFHEETHLKRKDYLFKYMGFLALALHWFNPLVWLAYYMAEKDMEMSCDEAVIKWIGSEEKRGYSQTLLSLSMPFREYRAMHLAFGEGETKQRIVNILSFKKPQAKYAVAIMSVIAVAGILLLSNPGLPNGLLMIGETEVTEFVIVTTDGYLSLSGDIAHTVTDNLKKTKIRETDLIAHGQGENYILCTTADGHFTINFNDDYTQMWLLDNDSETNGKVYDIANPDNPMEIGDFVKNNVSHYASKYETQMVKFPVMAWYHTDCQICQQIERFTVSVDLPRGWHFFSHNPMDEGKLIMGNIHNMIYLVNAFGETIGAMGFAIEDPQLDSSIDLMNHITETSGITFDTNDWRVWPHYGESVFTTCSYGNGPYENYCVLTQKTGIEPYVMMSFLPEKVSREQAEIISASIDIHTADNGTIRASHLTFWTADQNDEEIAHTAASAYLKEMLAGGEYKISDISITKSGENNGFDYPKQIFLDYDYVVRVAFSTTAPIFEEEKQFVNLIYLDKTADTDFSILGAVEHDASLLPQKPYATIEKRIVKTMYETVLEKDDTLTMDTYQITDPGEKGISYQQVTYTYENGVITSCQVDQYVDIKPTKKETVSYGTLLDGTEITPDETFVWNGTPIPGGSGKLIWPTSAGRISKGFVGQYPRHNGIDISADTGTFIYASDTGVVTKALYTNVGYGVYCIIEHGDYQTLYAHCSELFVRVGQKVQQGQLIGRVGSTGNSTGPHLHFEVKMGTTRYNPYNWF